MASKDTSPTQSIPSESEQSLKQAMDIAGYRALGMTKDEIERLVHLKPTTIDNPAQWRSFYKQYDSTYNLAMKRLSEKKLKRAVLFLTIGAILTSFSHGLRKTCPNAACALLGLTALSYIGGLYNLKNLNKPILPTDRSVRLARQKVRFAFVYNNNQSR